MLQVAGKVQEVLKVQALRLLTTHPNTSITSDFFLPESPLLVFINLNSLFFWSSLWIFIVVLVSDNHYDSYQTDNTLSAAMHFP